MARPDLSYQTISLPQHFELRLKSIYPSISKQRQQHKHMDQNVWCGRAAQCVLRYMVIQSNLTWATVGDIYFPLFNNKIDKDAMKMHLQVYFISISG